MTLPILSFKPFEESLSGHGCGDLRAAGLTTLQVNVGKLCNQACKHCHVDAGPQRKEIMSRETADRVLDALIRNKIAIIDITGGAPELNPSFRHLVLESRKAGAHVMVRHNLTVQFVEGMESLPEFFRDNQIEVIASLPYFLGDRTDAQRGAGVFDKSVEALKRLNHQGYGQEKTGLMLHLAYNPVGAYLPPDQSGIERDFKKEMDSRYGIRFNNLYTITNMPISRFLDYLRRSGNYERYMHKLVTSFNPATVEGLMCRTLISVSWDGRLYDCDFNQMIELPLAGEVPQTIEDFDLARLISRRINTGNHCYGCTAGAGSSCGGAVEK